MTDRPKWIICPVCEGDGTTVNPNIDAGGLTREDFLEDPDFMDDYMNGTYDISCAACGGAGKVRPDVPEKLADAVQDRRLAAMENGDFDAYCAASDYRYGY